MLDLRSADAATRASVLALNAAHETETSPLDAARLDAMLAEAFFAAAIPANAISGDAGVAAFLIAFDQGAAYDSPNFRWFRDRLPCFAYVDRIVTAPASRGRGLARRLYAALADAAAPFERVVCEVNVDPPNPASDRFHDTLGFREAGRARLANGKTVRYLERTLP
jgi:predicted GNAT superfamily acetyltransferase